MADYKDGESCGEWEQFIDARVTQVRLLVKENYGYITIPEHCDEFVERCLRVKDGNVSKAVQLIKYYHGVVEDFKKWDVTLQPSLHNENYYKNEPLALHRKRDDSGRHILMFRFSLWDHKTTDFDQMVACAWMLSQCMNVEFKDVQRHGFVLIWDFQNITLQQIWAIKQWRLPVVAKFIQSSIIGRLKGFHFINYPKIIGIMYSAVKHFFSEKMRQRIFFHDDHESLMNHVDPKILPDFLGGPLKTEEYLDKHFLSVLLTYDQFFLEMIKHGLPAK